ncbi:MAG: DUF3291 domain-containing protein, partial [Bacteroidales bacterium]|nr:DUF3291 domain-containing protein [Bacteroidales bacterium]
EQIWAMMQMAVAPRKMRRMDGLYFSKMLGTGGGFGYGFMPDFRTYALLTVWGDPEKASNFESGSEIMADFRKHCHEVYSIFLRPIQSRGKWSGFNPFIPSAQASDKGMLCVITRATLKFRYYIPFWKRVNRVSKSHEGFPGLLFTKGIGERPWIMQATFSVWKSVSDMQSFAYEKSGRHFEAISTTKRMKGFKEELYARFQPLESRGTWRGKDPLGLSGNPIIR